MERNHVTRRGDPSRKTDEPGLAEYALILALIAVVAIISLIFLGSQVSTTLMTAAAGLDRFVLVPVDVRISRANTGWNVVERITVSEDSIARIADVGTAVPSAMASVRQTITVKNIREGWQLTRLVDSQLVFERAWQLSDPTGPLTGILPSGVPVTLGGMSAFEVGVAPSADSVASIVAPERMVISTSPEGGVSTLDGVDYWTIPFNEDTPRLGFTQAPPWA